MDGPVSLEHEDFRANPDSIEFLASFERYVIQGQGKGHQQISSILLQLQVFQIKGQLRLHSDGSGATVYTSAPTRYSRVVLRARQFMAFMDDHQYFTEGAHVTFCSLTPVQGTSRATLFWVFSLRRHVVYGTRWSIHLSKSGLRLHRAEGLGELDKYLLYCRFPRNQQSAPHLRLGGLCRPSLGQVLFLFVDCVCEARQKKQVPWRLGSDS